MKSITQLQLERLLMATGRSQFVALTCLTDPDMRKRKNPHAATARKVSIVNGVICWQYSSAVNRQRAREAAPRERPAKFRPMPRAWGNRIKGTPLVSHVSASEGETRLYLEVKIQRRTNHYFDRETHQRIDESELAPFLKDAAEQPRQGVSAEILLRDFRLENIAELTLCGVRYTIAPAATELRNYFPPQAKATRPLSGRARPATAKRQPAKGAT